MLLCALRMKACERLLFFQLFNSKGRQKGCRMAPCLPWEAWEQGRSQPPADHCSVSGSQSRLLQNICDSSSFRVALARTLQKYVKRNCKILGDSP